MQRVLIVDDYEPNLKLYASIVKRVVGQEALAYEDPAEALHALKHERPALIIVDYQMPGMDGISFIQAVRALDGHASTPIAMLTGFNDRVIQSRAMAAGATVFLEKPLPLKEFTAHLRRFTGSASGDQDIADLGGGDRETIVRLHRAIQARDAALAERIRRARDLTVAIANELLVDQANVEALQIAALVYDIGMIAVPDKVLAAPSELSAHWSAVVRDHVNAGAAILAGGASALMHTAETIARFHHERFDGSGYPKGLHGEGIPLPARIMAVADTFTAMTSERPYRIEMEGSRALSEINARSGSAFDPVVVAALERMQERLPSTRRSA